MKTIHLIASIILYTINLPGQNYLPIHTSGDETTYNIVHEIWDGAFNESSTISGQTVIEGEQYFNVYHEFHTGIVGYLRQDSTNSKAWYRSIEDDNEYLIMDLNLSVGDSFYVKFINYGVKYAFVTSVDTFQNRKRVNLDYAYGGGFISDTISFIEGVGPNAYFFYQSDSPYLPVEQLFGFLTCKKYINGSLDFEYDPEDDDCIYITSTKEKLKTDIIKIYPNPSNGLIYLTVSDELNLQDYTYQLFNSIGQRVAVGDFLNNLETIVIKGKGVYFLVLLEKGVPVFAEKILVID